MGLLDYTVIGIIFMCLVSGHRVPRQIDLTPLGLDKRYAEETCTVNEQMGKCVHESFCNEEHTILPGGVIDDSELRQRKKCPRELDWCCTTTISTPNVESSINIGNLYWTFRQRKKCPRELDWCCTTTISTPNVESSINIGCTAPKPDTCPWCVSLYKSGGIRVTKTGLFCMGSMIGSKAVLTAGTCVKAAQKKLLWARVPASADPIRNYTVQYRQVHPQYDTGSHTHDFAILVLENDVIWNDNGWKGACLDFQTPMSGECMAFGLDRYENYVSTILSMKKGSCFKSKKISDAVCGELTDEDYCFVTIGSPVLCGVQGTMLLTGVARSPCLGETKAMLGRLALSGDWLEKELKFMGLSESQFKKPV